MRWNSDTGARTVRSRLDRSLRRIGVPMAGACTPHPHAHGRPPFQPRPAPSPQPQPAAARRRCHHAATNELFTDIEGAPDHPCAMPEVHTPRLRLCTV